VNVRSQLDLIKTNAGQFTTTVNEAARLAEMISDKVRQLDKEQSRAKMAIQHVENVQELKFCVAGLNEAMQKKEYDQAAVLLQRATKIDVSILKGSLAEYTVASFFLYEQDTLTDILCSLHLRILIIQKRH
jgi:hypothetical protein